MTELIIFVVGGLLGVLAGYAIWGNDTDVSDSNGGSVDEPNSDPIEK